MQNITTKDKVNKKGDHYVTAEAQAARLKICWDSNHSKDWNHRQAAQKLAIRLGWTYDFIGGFDNKNQGQWVAITRDHLLKFSVFEEEINKKTREVIR